MKLKVDSFTVNQIPAAAFNPAPAFGYPSGGNPSSIVVIPQAQISAFQVLTATGVAVPASMTTTVITCPITLLGTKTLSILGSMNNLEVDNGGGSYSNVMPLVVELWVGGTLVSSANVGPQSFLLPSYGLWGTFNPTVAGATVIQIKINNLSYGIPVPGPGPNVPFPLFPLSSVSIMGIEF